MEWWLIVYPYYYFNELFIFFSVTTLDNGYIRYLLIVLNFSKRDFNAFKIFFFAVKDKKYLVRFFKLNHILLFYLNINNKWNRQILNDDSDDDDTTEEELEVDREEKNQGVHENKGEKEKDIEKSKNTALTKKSGNMTDDISIDVDNEEDEEDFDYQSDDDVEIQNILNDNSDSENPSDNVDNSGKAEKDDQLTNDDQEDPGNDDLDDLLDNEEEEEEDIKLPVENSGDDLIPVQELMEGIEEEPNTNSTNEDKADPEPQPQPNGLEDEDDFACSKCPKTFSSEKRLKVTNDHVIHSS